MTIHIVQEGETLKYISEKYQIPIERLIIQNGITNPNNLVIGQTIVIVYPLITYTSENGEPLADIAEKFNVSVMELLRNNTNLSDREVLYPGETIIISYNSEKNYRIVTSGYVYSFINRDILIKTLPFLTYLTVFNYRVTEEAELVDINDTDIINLAKEYGVAPMMLISTLSEQGIGNSKIANTLYNDLEFQDKLMNHVIDMLKRKGYYGLNIYLQFLRSENRVLVEEYIRRFSLLLREEGFRFLISVPPRTNIEGTEISYETIDYSTLAQYVDGILFLSYDWAYSFGPPASATPINIVRGVLDYVITIVPSEKIFLGFPVIGYDWELPYIPGYTKARAITYDVAIELAALAGVTINYSEIPAAPYFYYTNELQEFHIVWFKDSRSIAALSGLVPEYDLQGISVWNIMRFFAQLWFVINTNYEIDKVENVDTPFIRKT